MGESHGDSALGELFYMHANLAERIAYHEARIAARERGENPDAATA